MECSRVGQVRRNAGSVRGEISTRGAWLVFPVQFNTSYYDTGVQSLGLSRLNADFVVGNPFTGSDTTGGQYPTDAEFRRTHAPAATNTNLHQPR